MYTIEQLKDVIRKKGYLWFDDKPNIIGIRNDNPASDKFDDEIYYEWRGRLLYCVATTDPGKYYLEHPANIAGCGMLVPGQYVDCWKLGLHNGKYIALVQVGNMKTYRDNDKDDIFEIDPATITSGQFGCNNHHTFNSEVQGNDFNVKNWSAMCQVVLHINQYVEAMLMMFDYDKFTGKLYSYTLLEMSDFK